MDTYNIIATITGVASVLFFMFPVGVILFRTSWAWLNDEEYDDPVWFMGTYEYDHNNVIVGGIALSAVGVLVSAVWPIAYTVGTLVLIAFLLRFLLRCGKSLVKLSQVAHDHSGEEGSPNSTYVPRPSFGKEYK
jgi:hypothetical protein